MTSSSLRAVCGAPVDHPLAPIDQSLLVEPDKDFLHLTGIIWVHSEPLPVPVARAAEALELLDDDPPVLLFPLPDPLEKLLPPQIAPCLLLLLAQLPLHHRLGGDAGVIGAGQPKYLMPRLPRPPGEDILQGIVEHVTEGEHTRDIGRRNNNGKTRFG